MDENNDTNMVGVLVDLFLSESPEQMRSLWAACARDAASLRATAHRLLSSVENIGARCMTALCVELEHCGVDESLFEVQPLLTHLTQELERVQALLAVERHRFGWQRG